MKSDVDRAMWSLAISDIGEFRTSTILRSVYDLLADPVAVIDAFGRACPPSIEDIRLRLMSLSERNGGYAIDISAGPRSYFDDFLQYAPYSAFAGIYQRAERHPVIEVTDGEDLNVYHSWIIEALSQDPGTKVPWLEMTRKGGINNRVARRMQIVVSTFDAFLKAIRRA